MKVIAENRDIIYSNSCGCSNPVGYSGASGDNPRASFQKWANENKKLSLRTDGIKDSATTDAYKKYGKEFESLSVLKSIDNAQKIATEKSKKSVLDTIANVIKPDATNPPVSDVKTKTPEEEKADKKKKMIKIALIAGGAIALTTIIILIARKKK